MGTEKRRMKSDGDTLEKRIARTAADLPAAIKISRSFEPGISFLLSTVH
jgi:hypothetical protein